MNEDEELLPDALTGHAEEAGGDDVAQAVLLLCGEVSKLVIVLSELDEASFSKVKPRLKVFQDLVKQLPAEGTQRGKRVRVIGFVAGRPSRRR